MKIPHISNYALSTFNENILPKLSPLQKKMGIIALVAFSLIAACYACWRCACWWNKEITPEEAVAQMTGPKLSANQENAINQVTAQFEKTVTPHFQNFQSGIFVVNGDFEKGSFTHQYLYKNEDGSPVTIDFATEIDKISETLKNELKQELGLHNRTDWFFLIKADTQKFYKVGGHFNNFYIPSIFITEGTSSLTEGKTARNLIYMIIQGLKIPEETLIKNGEFIAGEFYKDLNAPLPATPEM